MNNAMTSRVNTTTLGLQRLRRRYRGSLHHLLRCFH